MIEVNNVIKYFDLYTLDFSCVKQFAAGLENFEDSELKTAFVKAISAESNRANHAHNLSVIQVLENLVFAAPEIQKNPNKIFTDLYKDTKTCCENADNLLAEFNGADPFEIQELVHVILGISEKIHTECSEGVEASYSAEVKQQYYNLMKETGFCISNFCEEPIKYEPGKLAIKFLEENPDVKTLTLGCGKNVNMYPTACSFRRENDHAHPSLKIDLYSTIGPDLVCDMHNQDFWNAIPNEYFENIQDHTFGPFLFENDRTLHEVFRTLKPGGSLLMDHPFKAEHRKQLENAGFKFEDGEITIAQKTT